MELTDLIGKKVVKPSGKKFKSGNVENTVKGIVTHEITKNLAFTFEEDDSVCEIHRTLLTADYAAIKDLGRHSFKVKCHQFHDSYNGGIPLTVHKIDPAPKVLDSITPRPPRYDRLTTLTIDEVFAAIKENRTFTFGGKECNPLGHRVRTYYEHGIACVECGAKGQFFAVERDMFKSKGVLNDIPKYHLNFYAVVDGKELMMTVDHIHTKAEGGKDHVDNYQPMCRTCNRNKGAITREKDKKVLEERQNRKNGK